MKKFTDTESRHIDYVLQYLEEMDSICDYVTKAAIVRYLNKRGLCVMNISTIIQIIEND